MEEKMMSRYKVRKENIIQRCDAMEKKREAAYGEMTELENEINVLQEKILSNLESALEFKKQGDIMNSYLQFLENQLVIEALEQRSYSIENFDLMEQSRLIFALRDDDDLLFDWFVNKKQEGYEFNQVGPLHQIFMEDYEDFRAEQAEK